MSTDKELFDQYRDNKSLFDGEPDTELWGRLEQKLNNKRILRKVKFYKYLSFAAVFTVLIAAMAYFNHYLTDHNPDYYVSNEGFTAYSLEELKNDDDTFYNTTSITQIRSAYKGKTPNEKATLLGNYNAKGSDDAVQIKLIEYTYHLQFIGKDIPDLELVLKDGNLLHFESKKSEKAIFSLEDYGLRLMESNFLPEGGGVEYMRLEEI